MKHREHRIEQLETSVLAIQSANRKRHASMMSAARHTLSEDALACLLDYVQLGLEDSVAMDRLTRSVEAMAPTPPDEFDEVIDRWIEELALEEALGRPPTPLKGAALRLRERADMWQQARLTTFREPEILQKLAGWRHSFCRFYQGVAEILEGPASWVPRR